MLVKELPEVFEEFALQRQKSFLEIKEIKDQDIPVIGVYCTYFPAEIAMAMKAVVVSLCSTSNETIPVAEEVLPKNLCPLIKASYGFALSDKCPFFYFSDVVVGETTCDGKKKMYEFMKEFKDVFVLELPNTQSDAALELYRKEIIRFKEYLEKKFNTVITEEKIEEAIKVNNDMRKSLKNFYELMKMEPTPMSGLELFNVLYGSTFKVDRKDVTKEIDALALKVKKEYEEGKKQERKPRILVTGCPLGGASMKVVEAIENNGGVVVAYENCSGTKNIDRLVEEDSDDVYMALARRYLHIGCSVMTPNPNRFESLGTLIDEYQVDAVVEMTLQACHTYNIESGFVQRFVRSKGIPYLHVETDYSKSDIGQLNTRITALLEML